jgi:NTP pyrophosphatase (non-canonical NTP hydrolase)
LDTAARVMREYQRQVMAGMRVKPGTDRLSHAALGLAGEAGEVADQIKKSQYEGGTLDEHKLVNEMGDTLWYLTYLCGRLGITIPDLAKLNIRKLAARRPDDYTVIP